MRKPGSPSASASARCSWAGRIVDRPRNRSARPPRASRDRSSPARNARGTVTSEQAPSQSNGRDVSPVASVWTSNAANTSRQSAPAMPGSRARRPGADARRHRTARTAAVATGMATNVILLRTSIAAATPASGVRRKRLASNGFGVNTRCSGASTATRTRTAPVITRSAHVRSRPPARRVSTRGTKKSSHRSDSHSARVRATGWSSRPSTGARKTAKPASVMSRPLRLSGRRRHATNPHAANEAPTSRRTTCTGSTGRLRCTTNSASEPAVPAAAATHSAAQEARLAFITAGLKRRIRRTPAALRARSASSVMGTPARPRKDSRPGHRRDGTAERRGVACRTARRVTPRPWSRTE